MALLEEPIKEVKLLKNFIGGEWVESKGEIVDVVNPATGTTISKEARSRSAPGDTRRSPLALGRLYGVSGSPNHNGNAFGPAQPTRRIEYRDCQSKSGPSRSPRAL